MGQDVVLPKSERRRFSLPVRAIASVLIITFLAQDVVWANPDISNIQPRTIAPNNKLAPPLISRDPEAESHIVLSATDSLIMNWALNLLGNASGSQFLTPDQLSFGEFKGAMKNFNYPHASNNWFRSQGVSFEIHDDEIIVNTSSSHRLRYFQLKEDLSNFNKDKAVQTVLVSKQHRFYKQVLYGSDVKPPASLSTDDMLALRKNTSALSTAEVEAVRNIYPNAKFATGHTPAPTPPPRPKGQSSKGGIFKNPARFESIMSHATSTERSDKEFSVYFKDVLTEIMKCVDILSALRETASSMRTNAAQLRSSYNTLRIGFYNGINDRLLRRINADIANIEKGPAREDLPYYRELVNFIKEEIGGRFDWLFTGTAVPDFDALVQAKKSDDYNKSVLDNIKHVDAVIGEILSRLNTGKKSAPAHKNVDEERIRKIIHDLSHSGSPITEKDIVDLHNAITGYTFVLMDDTLRDLGFDDSNYGSAEKDMQMAELIKWVNEPKGSRRDPRNYPHIAAAITEKMGTSPWNYDWNDPHLHSIMALWLVENVIKPFNEGNERTGWALMDILRKRARILPLDQLTDIADRWVYKLTLADRTTHAPIHNPAEFIKFMKKLYVLQSRSLDKLPRDERGSVTERGLIITALIVVAGLTAAWLLAPFIPAYLKDMQSYINYVTAAVGAAAMAVGVKRRHKKDIDKINVAEAIRIVNEFAAPYSLADDINVMITNRCPYNCPMCIAKKLRRARKEDVPVEDLIRTIDQLEGIGRIRLTGPGETTAYGKKGNILKPGVSDDFRKIVEHASRAAREVWIVTNGHLIPTDPEEARKFFAGFPDNVVWALSADYEHAAQMKRVQGGRSLKDVVKVFNKLNFATMYARFIFFITYTNDTEFSRFIREYEIPEKYVVKIPVVRQGGAADNENATVRDSEHFLEHSLNEQRTRLFIDMDGFVVGSNHVAFMTEAERRSIDPRNIFGNIHKKSLTRILLEDYERNAVAGRGRGAHYLMDLARIVSGITGIVVVAALLVSGNVPALLQLLNVGALAIAFARGGFAELILSFLESGRKPHVLPWDTDKRTAAEKIRDAGRRWLDYEYDANDPEALITASFVNGITEIKEIYELARSADPAALKADAEAFSLSTMARLIVTQDHQEVLRLYNVLASSDTEPIIDNSALHRLVSIQDPAGRVFLSAVVLAKLLSIEPVDIEAWDILGDGPTIGDEVTEFGDIGIYLSQAKRDATFSAAVTGLTAMSAVISENTNSERITFRDIDDAERFYRFSKEFFLYVGRREGIDYSVLANNCDSNITALSAKRDSLMAELPNDFYFTMPDMRAMALKQFDEEMDEALDGFMLGMISVNESLGKADAEIDTLGLREEERAAAKAINALSKQLTFERNIRSADGRRRIRESLDAILWGNEGRPSLLKPEVFFHLPLSTIFATLDAYYCAAEYPQEANRNIMRIWGYVESMPPDHPFLHRLMDPVNNETSVNILALVTAAFNLDTRSVMESVRRGESMADIPGLPDGFALSEKDRIRAAYEAIGVLYSTAKSLRAKALDNGSRSDFDSSIMVLKNILRRAVFNDICKKESFIKMEVFDKVVKTAPSLIKMTRAERDETCGGGYPGMLRSDRNDPETGELTMLGAVCAKMDSDELFSEEGQDSLNEIVDRFGETGGSGNIGKLKALTAYGSPEMILACAGFVNGVMFGKRDSETILEFADHLEGLPDSHPVRMAFLSPDGEFFDGFLVIQAMARALTPGVMAGESSTYEHILPFDRLLCCELVVSAADNRLATPTNVAEATANKFLAFLSDNAGRMERQGMYEDGIKDYDDAIALAKNFGMALGSMLADHRAFIRTNTDALRGSIARAEEAIRTLRGTEPPPGDLAERIQSLESIIGRAREQIASYEDFERGQAPVMQGSINWFNKHAGMLRRARASLVRRSKSSGLGEEGFYAPLDFVIMGAVVGVAAAVIAGWISVPALIKLLSMAGFVGALGIALTRKGGFLGMGGEENDDGEGAGDSGDEGRDEIGKSEPAAPAPEPVAARPAGESGDVVSRILDEGALWLHHEYDPASEYVTARFARGVRNIENIHSLIQSSPGATVRAGMENSDALPLMLMTELMATYEPALALKYYEELKEPTQGYNNLDRAKLLSADNPTGRLFLTTVALARLIELGPAGTKARIGSVGEGTVQKQVTNFSDNGLTLSNTERLNIFNSALDAHSAMDYFFQQKVAISINLDQVKEAIAYYELAELWPTPLLITEACGNRLRELRRMRDDLQHASGIPVGEAADTAPAAPEPEPVAARPAGDAPNKPPKSEQFFDLPLEQIYDRLNSTLSETEDPQVDGEHITAIWEKALALPGEHAFVRRLADPGNRAKALEILSVVVAARQTDTHIVLESIRKGERLVDMPELPAGVVLNAEERLEVAEDATGRLFKLAGSLRLLGHKTMMRSYFDFAIMVYKNMMRRDAQEAGLATKGSLGAIYISKEIGLVQSLVAGCREERDGVCAPRFPDLRPYRSGSDKALDRLIDIAGPGTFKTSTFFTPDGQKALENIAAVNIGIESMASWSTRDSPPILTACSKLIAAAIFSSRDPERALALIDDLECLPDSHPLHRTLIHPDGGSHDIIIELNIVARFLTPDLISKEAAGIATPWLFDAMVYCEPIKAIAMAAHINGALDTVKSFCDFLIKEARWKAKPVNRMYDASLSDYGEASVLADNLHRYTDLAIRDVEARGGRADNKLIHLRDYAVEAIETIFREKRYVIGLRQDHEEGGAPALAPPAAPLNAPEPDIFLRLSISEIRAIMQSHFSSMSDPRVISGSIMRMWGPVRSLPPDNDFLKRLMDPDSREDTIAILAIVMAASHMDTKMVLDSVRVDETMDESVPLPPGTAFAPGDRRRIVDEAIQELLEQADLYRSRAREDISRQDYDWAILIYKNLLRRAVQHTYLKLPPGPRIVDIADKSGWLKLQIEGCRADRDSLCKGRYPGIQEYVLGADRSFDNMVTASSYYGNLSLASCTSRRNMAPLGKIGSDYGDPDIFTRFTVYDSPQSVYNACIGILNGTVFGTRDNLKALGIADYLECLPDSHPMREAFLSTGGKFFGQFLARHIIAKFLGAHSIANEAGARSYVFPFDSSVYCELADPGSLDKIEAVWQAIEGAKDFSASLLGRAREPKHNIASRDADYEAVINLTDNLALYLGRMLVRATAKDESQRYRAASAVAHGMLNIARQERGELQRGGLGDSGLISGPMLVVLGVILGAVWLYFSGNLNLPKLTIPALTMLSGALAAFAVIASTQTSFYQDFAEALEAQKNGTMQWERTTDEMQMEFLEMLAASDELKKNDVRRLLLADFDVHAGCFGGTNLRRLINYYTDRGRLTRGDAMKELKRRLKIGAPEKVKPQPELKTPYGSFKEAARALADGTIDWGRVVVSDEIELKFIKLFASSIKRTPEKLTLGDMTRKSFSGIKKPPFEGLNGKRISGLLHQYVKMSGSTPTEALIALKEKHGIEDLAEHAGPKDEIEWRNNGMPPNDALDKVCDILNEHLNAGVSRVTVDTYLTGGAVRFNAETDFEMGKEAQSGNVEAKNAFVKAYANMVRGRVKRVMSIFRSNKPPDYRFPEEFNFNNLEQVGLIVLDRLAQGYNPAKKRYRFSTYAYNSVYGELLRYVRKIMNAHEQEQRGIRANGHGERGRAEQDDGNELIDSIRRSKPDLPDDGVIPWIEETLRSRGESPRNVNIFLACLNGISNREIGHTHGVGHSRVDQIKQRCLRKIENELQPRPFDNILQAQSYVRRSNGSGIAGIAQYLDRNALLSPADKGAFLKILANPGRSVKSYYGELCERFWPGVKKRLKRIEHATQACLDALRGWTPAHSTSVKTPETSSVPAPMANEDGINFDAFRRYIDEDEKGSPLKMSFPVIEDEDCVRGGKYYSKALISAEGGLLGIIPSLGRVLAEEYIEAPIVVEPFDSDPMYSMEIRFDKKKKPRIVVNEAFVRMIAWLLDNGYGNISVDEIVPERRPKPGDPIPKTSDLVTSIIYSAAIHEIRAHLKNKMEDPQAHRVRGRRYGSINAAAITYYWSLTSMRDLDRQTLRDFLLSNYRLIGDDEAGAETNVSYYIDEIMKIEEQRLFRRLPKPPLKGGTAYSPATMRAMAERGGKEADSTEKGHDAGYGDDAKIQPWKWKEIEEAERAADLGVTAQPIKKSREKKRTAVLLEDLCLDPNDSVERYIHGDWKPLDCLLAKIDSDKSLQHEDGSPDPEKVGERLGVKPGDVRKWLRGEGTTKRKLTNILLEKMGFDDICFVLSGIKRSDLDGMMTTDPGNTRQVKLLGLRVEVLMFERGIPVKGSRKSLGITEDRLMKIRGGISFPFSAEILKLAEGLKVTPARLLGVGKFSMKDVRKIDTIKELVKLEKMVSSGVEVAFSSKSRDRVKNDIIPKLKAPGDAALLKRAEDLLAKLKSAEERRGKGFHKQRVRGPEDDIRIARDATEYYDPGDSIERMGFSDDDDASVAATVGTVVKWASAGLLLGAVLYCYPLVAAYLPDIFKWLVHALGAGGVGLGVWAMVNMRRKPVETSHPLTGADKEFISKTEETISRYLADIERIAARRPLNVKDAGELADIAHKLYIYLASRGNDAVSDVMTIIAKAINWKAVRLTGDTDPSEEATNAIPLDIKPALNEIRIKAVQATPFAISGINRILSSTGDFRTDAARILGLLRWLKTRDSIETVVVPDSITRSVAAIVIPEGVDLDKTAKEGSDPSGSDPKGSDPSFWSLLPDAGGTAEEALLKAIEDDNDRLLQILGFRSDMREALRGVVAAIPKNMFGHKLASVDGIDRIRGIGKVTVENALGRIRLAREYQARYGERFARFASLALNIAKGDTEDAVSGRIKDIFPADSHLLRDAEFLRNMENYFEHDPQALLSLAYVVWAEIRAGPQDESAPFVEILKNLADKGRDRPISNYNLASIRYLNRLKIKKVYGLLRSLLHHPPRDPQFYAEAYGTLVELAREGDLRGFYEFIKRGQPPEAARLAIRAVSEARPGTDSLARFLDTAARNGFAPDPAEDSVRRPGEIDMGRIIPALEAAIKIITADKSAIANPTNLSEAMADDPQSPYNIKPGDLSELLRSSSGDERFSSIHRAIFETTVLGRIESAITALRAQDQKITDESVRDRVMESGVSYERFDAWVDKNRAIYQNRIKPLRPEPPSMSGPAGEEDAVSIDHSERPKGLVRKDLAGLVAAAEEAIARLKMDKGTIITEPMLALAMKQNPSSPYNIEYKGLRRVLRVYSGYPGVAAIRSAIAETTIGERIKVQRAKMAVAGERITERSIRKNVLAGGITVESYDSWRKHNRPKYAEAIGEVEKELPKPKVEKPKVEKPKKERVSGTPRPARPPKVKVEMPAAELVEPEPRVAEPVTATPATEPAAAPVVVPAEPAPVAESIEPAAEPFEELTPDKFREYSERGRIKLYTEQLTREERDAARIIVDRNGTVETRENQVTLFKALHAQNTGEALRARIYQYLITQNFGLFGGYSEDKYFRDYESAEAESRIILMNCVRAFNYHNETLFSTYVYGAFGRSLISALRRSAGKRPAHGHREEGPDALDDVIDDQAGDPAEDAFTATEHAVAVGEYRKVLDSLNVLKPENQVLLKIRYDIGTVDGAHMAEDELGGLMGMTGQGVGDRQRKAEYKLRRRMESPGSFAGYRKYPVCRDHADVYVVQKLRISPLDPRFGELVKLGRPALEQMVREGRAPEPTYPQREALPRPEPPSMSGTAEDYVSDNLWGRPGRKPTEREQGLFQHIIDSVHRGPSYMPKENGIFSINVYNRHVLRGEPLEEENNVLYYRNPDGDNVAYANSGHFVMVREGHSWIKYVASVGHQPCTACSIKAVDAKGEKWIGHLHISASDKPYEQLIAALSYLEGRGFIEATIQLDVNKDTPKGLPIFKDTVSPEFAAQFKKMKVDVLPLLTRSASDKIGGLGASVVVGFDDIMVFHYGSFHALSVKPWSRGPGEVSPQVEVPQLASSAGKPTPSMGPFHSGPVLRIDVALNETDPDLVAGIITENDKRFREGLAVKPLAEGQQVLLSEALFDELDKENLARLLADNKFVRIASRDEVRSAATNKKSDRGKVSCVMTRDEFDAIRKTHNLDLNKDAVKATILPLDSKLTGANYLYLEGVVGLAKAMMDKDAVSARAFMRMLFGDITIDGAIADDERLEDFLKKSDSLELALHLILRFKPITRIATEEDLNRYKAMVENLLMAA